MQYLRKLYLSYIGHAGKITRQQNLFFEGS
jgi:hypothetical protein